MAALQGNGTGTATVKSLFERGATNPLTDQSRQEEARPRPETRTVSRVDRCERGDREAKDVSAASDGTSSTTDSAPAAAATRRELAAQLSRAIARVIAGHGSVKMATALQLLKRELSRSHDVLGPLKTENDYLSIVVLVETGLGTKDWKAISKQELNALRAALEIGAKEPRVTFDDYNRTFRLLNASGWGTGPSFEFADPDEPPPA